MKKCKIIYNTILNASVNYLQLNEINSDEYQEFKVKDINTFVNFHSKLWFIIMVDIIFNCLISFFISLHEDGGFILYK